MAILRSRYGGQSAGQRWERLGVGIGGLERAQRWFDRYGGHAVFIGRLLPAVRTFISLPAGFARMQPLRFGLYTVAGCVPWITGLAWAGWAAGGNWHNVTALVQNAGYAAGGLAGVLLIAAIVFWVRARRWWRPGVAAAGRTCDTGQGGGSGPGAQGPAAEAAQQRRAS